MLNVVAWGAQKVYNVVITLQLVAEQLGESSLSVLGSEASRIFLAGASGVLPTLRI
mgnify:CR=1